MSVFEWISTAALLVSAAFALVMLWYRAACNLEEVRFHHAEETQKKIQQALGSLAKDLHGFKDTMHQTVSLLTDRLHSLELTLAKQSSEMRLASEEMRDVHRAFELDWKTLRKGWGQEIRPGEYLVKEPKPKGE